MLLKNNIPFSYIFGKIKWELLAISIYGILIDLLYFRYPSLDARISIPIAVPMVLGTIISLLLGFRSNQAYDRWWEARIIWGAMVNDSRSFAREIICFVHPVYEGDQTKIFIETIIKRQMAWCHALACSLRNTDPISAIKHLITMNEIDYISSYNNKPNALLELHGHDLKTALKEGWINEYQQIEIDRTLSKLCDSMGKCERIKNTVFPVTYSLYIHFALVLFIMLLPFGLIEFFGIMETPMMIAISASFLLIEKMAIHLQDPFENKPTDTPMTAISQTIERDLKQMLKELNIPQPSAADHFYLM